MRGVGHIQTIRASSGLFRENTECDNIIWTDRVDIRTYWVYNFRDWAWRDLSRVPHIHRTGQQVDWTQRWGSWTHNNWQCSREKAAFQWDWKGSWSFLRRTLRGCWVRSSFDWISGLSPSSCFVFDFVWNLEKGRIWLGMRWYVFWFGFVN